MTGSSELVSDLHTMARSCRKAATRAADLNAEDERQKAALTLRLVADRCTDAHPETLDVARTFLDAGAKMLAAWDVVDMDAVHASRAARRDAYAVRQAQNAWDAERAHAASKMTTAAGPLPDDMVSRRFTVVDHDLADTIDLLKTESDF